MIKIELLKSFTFVVLCNKHDYERDKKLFVVRTKVLNMFFMHINAAIKLINYFYNQSKDRKKKLRRQITNDKIF